MRFLEFLLITIFSAFCQIVISKTTDQGQSFNVKMISKDSRELRSDKNEIGDNNMLNEHEALYNKGELHAARYRRQLRPVPPSNDSSSSNEQSSSCPSNLSCRNNCSNPRIYLQTNKISCLCDKDCTFFKDCCADFSKYCTPRNRSHQIDNQEGLVSIQNKDLWGCYDGEPVKGSSGFWMIGTCPKTWPKDNTFYQCRNLSSTNEVTKDNYHYLPVYTSKGIVYHNRFCAHCNGIQSKDLKNYTLSIQCSVIPPESLSTEKQIDFLFKHCESNKINWSPPVGGPRRFCITLTDYSIIRCRRDVDGKCSNGSVGIVSVIRSKENYKSKHCADLCDGSGTYDCGPNVFEYTGSFFPKSKPFSFIFDFTGSNNRKQTKTFTVRCPFQKPLYDPYLQICRKGLVAVPHSTQASREQLFEVVLWLKATNPLDFRTSMVFRDMPIDSKNAEKILKINHQQLRNCRVSSKSSTLLTFKTNLNVSLEKDEKENGTRLRRSLESTKDKYIQRILNFQDPFEVSFIILNLTVFKVTTRILGCVNLQKYNRHEYTVSSKESPAVVIIKTNEQLKPNDFYTLNDTSANDSQAIFICRNYQRPQCSAKWVLMNEGEFVVLENKSVYVNSSKHTFGLQNYIWANHSVFVCENFSRTYHKKRKLNNKDFRLAVILTYVCMSISIIALVFVLVTYSLFVELRTPPGINIMNLCVSILVAKSLWLFGSGHTDKPVACTVVAILVHYFFLVSFVWTSIIAFDTWRAFTAKGRRSMADSKHKRLLHILRYMAVGWLSVMVYVAVCVALDLTNTVTIGYRSRQACWMGNSRAILYSFGIPLAMIIIFNAIFFAMTLKAIKNTTTQARAATDQNSRKQSFGVYVRIASVMGFTWVLGFIAPFTPPFVLYLFIIMNGLEGLYIALAFALNQRARNLYRNRFHVLAGNRNTIGTDTTKCISKSFEKLGEENKIEIEDTKL